MTMTTTIVVDGYDENADDEFLCNEVSRLTSTTTTSTATTTTMTTTTSFCVTKCPGRRLRRHRRLWLSIGDPSRSLAPTPTEFRTNTVIRKNALSVPVLARSNMPWGPKISSKSRFRTHSANIKKISKINVLRRFWPLWRSFSRLYGRHIPSKKSRVWASKGHFDS